MFRDLRDAGFHGTLSIELFNPNYYRQDPKQVARTALEKTRAILADALNKKRLHREAVGNGLRAVPSVTVVLRSAALAERHRPAGAGAPAFPTATTAEGIAHGDDIYLTLCSRRRRERRRGG